MTNHIGNTIWAQMRALDRNLIMCMGVHKLCLIKNGLQFKVKGLIFKGIVEITLNGSDLYDIKFLKPKRKLNKEMTEAIGRKFFHPTVNEQVKEINDVYFDYMMPTLETEVERRGVYQDDDYLKN